MDKGLPFWIWEVKELSYLCSENIVADQQLLFVFAYAKSRFYDDAAHKLDTGILHDIRVGQALPKS